MKRPCFLGAPFVARGRLPTGWLDKVCQIKHSPVHPSINGGGPDAAPFNPTVGGPLKFLKEGLYNPLETLGPQHSRLRATFYVNAVVEGRSAESNWWPSCNFGRICHVLVLPRH